MIGTVRSVNPSGTSARVEWDGFHDPDQVVANDTQYLEVIGREGSLDTRHPSSQRFHDLLKQLGDLHDKKMADYGRKDDPFANVRGSQEWGIPPWVGAMVRGNDKVKRLQKFAAEGNLANEPVEDAFLDLAGYALIGLVLYREEQNKK